MDTQIPSDAAMAASGTPVLTIRRWVDMALEVACIGLVLAAVTVACLQVIMRYIFNAALPWPEEVATWVFTWAVMLGMALATGRGAHIAIDFVPRLLPGRAQAVLLFLTASVMVTASLVLLVHGLDYVQRAISASPALQLPMKYLFMAVPVGAAFNLFFLFWPDGRRGFVQGAGILVCGFLFYLATRNGAGLIYSEASGPMVLVGVGLVGIVLGVPVAFALVLASFTAFASANPILLVTIAQNMGASLNSFTLLAIPFFIMAAAVMNAGGITPRLVDLAMMMVGHLRGGLAQANVVTNTMLAGVSGSSTADASTIAKLMVPEMARRGYDRPFAAALTAAGSTLANLIPPSLGLIIYAALASVSVGALFVATLVPGLLMAAALMLVVWIISRRRGYGGDLPKASRAERLRGLMLAIPALILPVIIVGGVRFGVFTATEAGAVAMIYALFCGTFLYRKLTGRNLIAAVRDAVLDTVVIVIIIAAASPFAWVLAFERVPQQIAAGLAVLVERPWLLMLAINIFLLIVGLFMEMIAALVILVPILVPLVVMAGFDPITFGLIIVMNLVIGALTPPLGVLIFTTARAGGADQVATFRAVLPFLVAMICVLMLVSFVPALTQLPLRWLGP
ncbi:TRAP transporter large permease subunit [Pseudotabrizicola sp. 4114]|uniref:TRAP transporter large permease n=1 Tax=Pseudotabrizicola sp. 4114 TaxID=2817731 RepID=UPI0028591F51|nr:tripartite ATP-independent transporter DctM subunit [Pseudorhodobacter sp. 4114]